MFPVSNKVSIFVTMLICILCAYFIGTSLMKNRLTFDMLKERDKRQLTRLTVDLPNRLMNLLEIHNTIILENKDIINAFEKRDRQTVARLLVPYFRQMRQEFENVNIIMHFHLPDGTSFYRAHQPDRFGDNLTEVRPLLNAVINDKSKHGGFEVGKYGLPMRFIAPVFVNNTYIGSFETGFDISFLAKRLSKLTSYQVSLLIKMTSTAHYNLKLDNKVSFDYFEMFDTNKALFSKIYQKINNKPIPEMINVDDKVFYLIPNIPIVSFNGETVGYFVFALDITEEALWSRNYLLKSIIATFVIVVFTIIIIRKGFREMIGGLEKKYSKTIVDLANKETQRRKYIISAPLAVFVLDNDMNMLETNPAAENMTGYSAEEMKYMNFMALMDTESISEARDAKNKLAENGELREKLSIKTKKGSVIKVLIDAAAMAQGMNIAFCRDITIDEKLKDELRRTYQDLEMMNKHLMKKVEEEIARRQKSEKHLETQKKFADMGQMINAIAHQWRQPLNGLGLYIQDMAENIREDKFTEEDVDEFENASMTLINNMSRTIDDFRSYFLPQNEKAVFNVAFEMIALMKLLSAQLSSKDINFTISCSCDDEMEECANLKDFPECLHEHADIFGYSGEFKQAMMNIITNAIDAIDERKNDINSEKGMIKVIITCYNKKIKVTIKDNGRGIPEENLSKIYDPYFTTKPQGSGTGIGLYVTRLLIEKHMGGRINTYNNPEGGTGVDIIFSQGK